MLPNKMQELIHKENIYVCLICYCALLRFLQFLHLP